MSAESVKSELICAKVHMIKVKDTTNTTKFAEEQQPGQPPIIGVLYIQKWWTGSAKRLEVEVRKVEA